VALDVPRHERGGDAAAQPGVIRVRARQHHVLGEISPAGPARAHEVDDVSAGHLEAVVLAEDLVDRRVFGDHRPEHTRGEPFMLAPRGREVRHRIVAKARHIEPEMRQV
jgi:hypothetical protein